MTYFSSTKIRDSIAKLGRFLAVAAFFHLAAHPVLAQADINNGTIRLGVSPLGGLSIVPIQVPLNAASGTTHLSIRFMPTNNEGDGIAASEEGWGVADVTSAKWGGSYGGSNSNLTTVSFTSTANSAVATVTADGVFEVTHDYRPSVNPNLYENFITVKNISAAPVLARYRRIFDWDVDPTPASEYLTIQGTANPGILSFTDNGKGSPNPLVAPPGVSGDVVNAGPGDKGTTVTVDLGTLASGASTTFKLYYGAAADRPSAAAAVAAVSVPVYALVQPTGTPATVGAPNTFIFGFGPGVIVTESGGSTAVTEGGVTDTYTVVLTYAPSADVAITPVPGPQLTVVPATMTFTAANWNVPQIVTVTAVDDLLVEGPHGGTITHVSASVDTLYNGIPIVSVVANITDNDTGLPPPPPPPPPPLPTTGGGLNEGDYPGSKGLANGNGKEGTYGFGRHFRQPFLKGPYREPSGTHRVFNVAHQQQVQAAETDSGFGIVGWGLMLLSLLAPAALVFGRRRPA